MKILFFTDNFPPESNAPASRTYEHAVRWVRSGNDVTVVTCAPNFPQGRVFDGYRNKLWQVEMMDGIRVIRVWSYMAANSGVVKRTADYLSFMVASMVALPFMARPDVIVGTSPQFFTLIAARWASILKRRPWVLELRDIWPESIRAVGAVRHSLALRFLQKVEESLYRSATRIVTVTQSFKRILVERGVPENKIAVVTNGVDFGRYVPRAKDAALVEELHLENRFVVGYIGTHGMAHGLDTLLEAARMMLQREELRNVKMLFVGEGARRRELEERARDLNLANVHFVGPVSKEQVVQYWSVLDLAIIHLRKTELFKTTIPSKIFECMGMGLPILLGVDGEARELVETNGVGLAFPPEDAEGLVDGITTMYRDHTALDRYRKSGPVAARLYDRNALAQKMLGELALATREA